MSAKLIDYIDMDHRKHFDLICDDLRDGKPFTYSRFGDGEFNAILGKDGANCDGHKYFPDMGAELGNVLRSRPPYRVGIHHGAKEPLATETLDWLTGNRCLGIPFIWSGIFHDGLKKGWMPDFFDAIRGRKVCIIGPEHLRPIHDYIEYERFIEIPTQNCWYITKEVMQHLGRYIIPNSEQVILFCASMAANAWIHRVWEIEGDGVTLIDLGSGIDPYVGVKQRSYHHKAKL